MCHREMGRRERNRDLNKDKGNIGRSTGDRGLSVELIEQDAKGLNEYSIQN